MKFDREFARELCEQLGIEWDDQASVPTLQGVPLDQDDLFGLSTCPVSVPYWANVRVDRHDVPYDGNAVARLCA